MNNEKYVSIEFDKWENYYKPLQENYEKLLKDYNKLEEKSINTAIKELYNKYVGNGNLITFQKNNIPEYYRSYPSQRVNRFVGQIGLTEGAKIYANKLLEEKIKSIPKWIKWLFKIREYEA